MNDSTTLPTMRCRGMPRKESIEKNRLALAKPQPPSTIGSSSAGRYAGSIWASPAMTTTQSAPSSSARRWAVRMAPPTPLFCSWRTSSTRGSASAPTFSAVASVEQSSTITMWSTKSGIVSTTFWISSSSLCAGTDTEMTRSLYTGSAPGRVEHLVRQPERLDAVAPRHPWRRAPGDGLHEGLLLQEQRLTPMLEKGDLDHARLPVAGAFGRDVLGVIHPVDGHVLAQQ